MDTELRQRLLGAAILISAAILIIPMLLETERPALDVAPVPEPGVDAPAFTYERLPDDPAAAGAGADDAVAPKPDFREPEHAAFEPRPEWYVQVGLFENADNAEGLRALLRGAGYPAGLHAEAGGGRQRVRVGPYYSQTRAEHALAGIRAKETLAAAHEGWVVRQP